MELHYEQLSLFLNSINEAAKSSTEKIIREAEEYRVAELDKAKEQAAETGWQYIKRESEKLKAGSNREVSGDLASLRKEFYVRRNQIAEAVLDQVRERLTAFTSTEEYKAFLLDSVRKIAESFSGDAFVLYVSKEDITHRNLLVTAAKAIEKVEADDSITIGGCKAFSKKRSLEIDDTLDIRLEKQKEYFYSSCGLQFD